MTVSSDPMAPQAQHSSDSTPFPVVAAKWMSLEPQKRADSLDGWLDLLDRPVLRARAEPALKPVSPRPKPKPREFVYDHERDFVSEALPEGSGWGSQMGRFVVGPKSWSQVEHLLEDLESRASSDPFEVSGSTIRRAFPIAWALHRFYFRVFSSGHRHVPCTGAAVLAANHGGLLPFDGVMAITDLLLHQDPPRLTRTILDRWVADLPGIRGFMARAGQVIGTHENFDTLLDREELVLVFPEGINGIRKTISHHNQLEAFRHGFIAKAIRARVPIIPVAIVGSENQAPILYDVKPLARRLHLPVFPITPTFPWLGPLGLLPYPVSYRIIYGEPMRFHEHFGPETADDPIRCRNLAVQVRRRIQEMIDGVVRKQKSVP